MEFILLIWIFPSFNLKFEECLTIVSLFVFSLEYTSVTSCRNEKELKHNPSIMIGKHIFCFENRL